MEEGGAPRKTCPNEMRRGTGYPDAACNQGTPASSVAATGMSAAMPRKKIALTSGTSISRAGVSQPSEQLRRTCVVPDAERRVVQQSQYGQTITTERTELQRRRTQTHSTEERFEKSKGGKFEAQLVPRDTPGRHYDAVKWRDSDLMHSNQGNYSLAPTTSQERPLLPFERNKSTSAGVLSMPAPITTTPSVLPGAHNDRPHRTVTEFFQPDGTKIRTRATFWSDGYKTNSKDTATYTEGQEETVKETKTFSNPSAEPLPQLHREAGVSKSSPPDRSTAAESTLFSSCSRDKKTANTKTSKMGRCTQVVTAPEIAHKPKPKSTDDTFPDHFLCPITGKLMTDPVLAPDGITYERSALMQFLLGSNSTLPFSQERVNEAQLVPNFVLKKEMNDFQHSKSSQSMAPLSRDYISGNCCEKRPELSPSMDAHCPPSSGKDIAKKKAEPKPNVESIFDEGPQGFQDSLLKEEDGNKKKRKASTSIGNDEAEIEWTPDLYNNHALRISSASRARMGINEEAAIGGVAQDVGLPTSGRQGRPSSESVGGAPRDRRERGGNAEAADARVDIQTEAYVVEEPEIVEAQPMPGTISGPMGPSNDGAENGGKNQRKVKCGIVFPCFEVSCSNRLLLVIILLVIVVVAAVMGILAGIGTFDSNEGAATSDANIATMPPQLSGPSTLPPATMDSPTLPPATMDSPTLPPAMTDSPSPPPKQDPRFPGFRLGGFTANYYKGSTFVHSETVSRPAINYAWSDFHNIRSEAFQAVWTGTLEVWGTTQYVDIEFDIGHAEATLLIDGKKTDYNNAHGFSVGVHSIEITFKNDWHTTRFNTAFTSHPWYTISEAMFEILKLTMSASTIIAHVNTYEPADTYNDITIILEALTQPVFLILTSYHSANWTIANPFNVGIAGIAYGSYEPGQMISAEEGVATFAISDLGHDPKVDEVTRLTGRPTDRSYDQYAMKFQRIK